MNDNLPPGCSVSDIPGNRPEDVAFDELIDDIAASGLTAQESRLRWESGDYLLRVLKRTLQMVEALGGMTDSEREWISVEARKAILKAEGK